jgi:hypothetical protein
MPRHTLRRTFEVVSTAHAASTGVAKTEAADAIREALTEADDGTIDSIETDATDIYEFPSGPFDPYRVHVTATVTTSVEADSESAAIDAGTDRIESMVAAADLDDVEFDGPAVLDDT